MKQQMFQSRTSLLKSSHFLLWGNCKLALLSRIIVTTQLLKEVEGKQIKKVDLHAFVCQISFWLVGRCICGQKWKNLLHSLFSFSLVTNDVSYIRINLGSRNSSFRHSSVVPPYGARFSSFKERCQKVLQESIH